MPKDKPGDEFNFSNYFSDLSSSIGELFDEGVGTELNIIEFFEQEVKMNIELTPQQKVILKAYYSLPLTEAEQSILEYWASQEKATWQPGQDYQVLILQIGRRAGKSTLVSLLVVYEFYRLCRMASPQAFYGIAESTAISVLAIATTARQAKRTIFSAIAGMIRRVPYFQSLIRQQKLFVGKEEISYDEKLLYIYAGNSESGSQVGGTVKCVVLDEAARFQSSDGQSNALELWKNIGVSTITFGRDARMIAMSSAWYIGDAIEQLFDKTKIQAYGVGFDLKSWEVNPIHAARDNPAVSIFYDTDPIQAALEFENIRPSAKDAFLKKEEVKRAIRGKSCVRAQRYINSADQLVALRLEGLQTGFNLTTAMHLDPAVTTDTYAVAFGHSEVDDQHRLVVVIDGILAWEPDAMAQVSISNVQELITQIHAARPLVKITADHYNPETIQRLRQAGMNAEGKFFSNQLQLQMYENLRQMLHEDRVVLPADSTWSPLLERELCQVQLLRQIKIDHPKNGSKDLADAIAGVCWELAGRPAGKQQRMSQVVSTQVMSTPGTNFSDRRLQVLQTIERGSGWSPLNYE